MKILPHFYLWGVIMLSWICFAITDAGQLWIYLNRMFGIGDAINFNPLDWLNAIRRYGIYLAEAALCSTGLVSLHHIQRPRAAKANQHDCFKN